MYRIGHDVEERILYVGEERTQRRGEDVEGSQFQEGHKGQGQ